MSIREIRELRSTKLLQEQPVSQKKDKYLKNFSLTTTRINNGSQGNINTRLNKIEELLVKLTENSSESKFDGRGQSDGQARFKQLKYTYNNILGLSQKQRIDDIKVFVSDLLRKVLSKAFTWFQQGKITDHKLRHFFCNNFISNLANYAHDNQLNEKQLMILDNHLKQNTIPFVKLRYPQNQSLQTNQQFNRLIIPVDNFQSNQNDLIHQSGVKFQYKPNGDYSKQIMEFINFLINITKQKVKQKQKQTDANLYTLFCQQMQSIFQRVQNQQWVILAHSGQFQKAQQVYKKQKQSKKQAVQHMNKEQKQAFIELQAKKQKYKKMVKQYTKYLIGQKLSNNLQPFTQKQIKDENLSVTNSGVMRILTKWCQDLQKNFAQSSITNRDQRFRMEDGTERYIKKDLRKNISDQLKKSNEDLTKFVDQVKSNIYQNQYHMLKDGRCLTAFRDFASEGQGITGYFATVMKKSNQNYLISYLNKLIHCIIAAQQSFKSRYSKKQHYKTAVNLVNFRIGDLLRCKCASKQRQIIALYTYLKYYCSKPQNRSKLQLVRVKNRLSEGTKDILINFRFQNKILVQMQLSINQQSSTFIKCSDKVNHFVYQLQRATFGPISQMCNVYRVVDPRAQFFNKVFEGINDQNNYKKLNDSNCRLTYTQKKHTSLPVWCQQCGKFVADLNLFKKHSKCLQQGCKKSRCAACNIRNNQIPQIQTQNKQKAVRLNYKQIMKIKDPLIKKKIIVLDLYKKKQQYSVIYMVQFSGKIMLFQYSKSKGLSSLGTAKNQKQLDKIFMNIQVLREQALQSSERQQKNQPINQQILKIQIKQIKKKMKKSFFFQQFSINEKMLQKQILQSVELINLTKNKLTSLKNLTTAFPNARIVFLSKNQITNIQGVHNWKNVEQLSLQGNQLSSLPKQIKQLQHLDFILLTNNKFKQFPEELCQLKKLRALNFKSNQVTKISDKIQNIKTLKIFRMNQNKITDLPPSLCKTNLQQIDLSINCVSSLPKQLSQLKTLKWLKLSQNKFKELDNDAFKGLDNLQKIDFSKNQISKIPQSLANKNLLTSINLMKNKLTNIPKFVFNLPNLQQINFTHNQISSIQPQEDFKSKKLITVLLNNNNLTQIPSFLFSALLIEKLNIGANSLKSIPIQEIIKLKNLRQLSLNQLGIKQFYKQLTDLHNLQYLNLDQNQIKQIPGSVKYWANCLKQLVLSKNKFEHIPNQVFLLRSLETLNLIQNNIKQVPVGLTANINLKNLKLNFNDIKTIPAQVLNMEKIREINLTLSVIQNLPYLRDVNKQVKIEEQSKKRKKNDDE